VNARAQAIERRLEGPMLVAALLVVPAIAIEQSEAAGLLNTIAVVINWATWLAFLAEAVLMLLAVDDRWRWIRDHPLEVAIVFVTPPFLPASLQAARVFRLLRLLPLLRAGLLARRLLTTEGVRDVAVLALLTVLGGGAAYAAVETDQDLTTWDGVWWGPGDRDDRRLRRHVPCDRCRSGDRGGRDARGYRLRGGADSGRRRAVHAWTRG
jgi:voltage-gated potassium channel